jgi:hypothetical protein
MSINESGGLSSDQRDSIESAWEFLRVSFFEEENEAPGEDGFGSKSKAKLEQLLTSHVDRNLLQESAYLIMGLTALAKLLIRTRETETGATPGQTFIHLKRFIS